MEENQNTEQGREFKKILGFLETIIKLFGIIGPVLIILILGLVFYFHLDYLIDFENIIQPIFFIITFIVSALFLVSYKAGLFFGKNNNDIEGVSETIFNTDSYADILGTASLGEKIKEKTKNNENSGILLGSVAIATVVISVVFYEMISKLYFLIPNGLEILANNAFQYGIWLLLLGGFLILSGGVLGWIVGQSIMFFNSNNEEFGKELGSYIIWSLIGVALYYFVIISGFNFISETMSSFTEIKYPNFEKTQEVGKTFENLRK